AVSERAQVVVRPVVASSWEVVPSAVLSRGWARRLHGTSVPAGLHGTSVAAGVRGTAVRGLLVTACLAVAMPAIAQPASPATATSTREVPPAPGAQVEAERLFEEGSEAYNLGKFDVAIERFEAAYNLSHATALLYNLGQAYSKRYEVDPDP